MVCQELLAGKLSGSRIASSLNEWIEAHGVKIDNVYIASPPMEETFCAEFESYFEAHDLGRVYYHLELLDFIRLKF